MNNFDEYQNIIRKKIAIQTLIITFSFIFINGIINSIYVWGTPLIEATVLIYVPTIYFVTMSVFKNVYLGLNENKVKGRIISFGLIASLNIFVVIRTFIFDKLNIIENGILQDCSATLFLASFFLYLTIIIIVSRFLFNHKIESD